MIMNGQILLPLATGILSWAITVAVMRQRVNELEQKFIKMGIDFGLSSKNALDRITAIEHDSARCDESRKGMESSIIKLDERKASKEMVDLFRSDLYNLSMSVEKRFDKIEDMLTKVLTNKN